MNNQQFNRIRITFTWIAIALFLIASGSSFETLSFKVRDNLPKICLMLAALLSASNIYRIFWLKKLPEDSESPKAQD